MVPDSHALRKQQQNVRKQQPSAKPSSGEPFEKARSRHTSSDSQESAAQKAAKKHSRNAFTYVPETLNDFLDLWPHRYDFLHAPHPDPGQKPDWKTESRHPLPDRLIEQGSELYGVRPGPKTSYVLLDIDKGSPYHPRRDPLALQRINEALEPLGLVAYLPLTSSYSGGVHLYYPDNQPLPSWKLAIAVTTLLENAGFKIMAGWLEVFPNPKPFSTDGSPSLFNGHRLPLQQGSYLLNDDLAPIPSSQDTFVRHWKQAAARNDISLPTLEQIIRQSRRQSYRVTGKAQKFINDLNAEIELGWTGSCQTNRLIGRITMRSYIFGHTLYASEPLSGQALVDDIVRIAIALPGYRDYCGHQHEIEKLARDWARSIENHSHYFPYATGKATSKGDTGPTWNEQQRQSARDRIQAAVLDLFRQDKWPSGITARFKLLLDTAQLSGATLYKHQDLWHPDFIRLSLNVEPVEIPPDPPDFRTRAVIDSAVGGSITASRTSLLGAGGCNTPQGKGFSPPSEAEKAPSTDIGCNRSSTERARQEPPSEPPRCPPPPQLALDIKRALAATRAAQKAQREANLMRQKLPNGQSLSEAEHLAMLHEWVDSGEPILRAEALTQLRSLKARGEPIMDD